jgi:hypothetical protein
LYKERFKQKQEAQSLPRGSEASVAAYPATDQSLQLEIPDTFAISQFPQKPATVLMSQDTSLPAM